MFKDFIESILIFLDGREKIVAQIVIYLFLFSGWGYFIFFYEWDIEENLWNIVISTDSGAIQNQTDITINSTTSDVNSSAGIVNEAGEVVPSKIDTPSFNTNWANQTNTDVRPTSNQNQTSLLPDMTSSQSSSISPNIPSTINPSPKIEVLVPEKEKEQAIIEPIVAPKKEEVIPQDTITQQDQITQNTATAQTPSIINKIQQIVQNIFPSNTTPPTTNSPQNTGNIDSWTSTPPPENTGTSTSGWNTTNTETTGETTWGTTWWTPPQDTGNITPPPENTDPPTWGETPPPTWDSGTSLVDEGEPSIEDYFNNEVIINTGLGGPKQVKIVVQTSLSPTYPVPNSCSVWFTEMWVYSNISALTTLFVPYSDQYGTTMSIINEYEVLSSWIKKYYKVFIINSVKNGAVLYKTVNPNNDYHRAFTICVEE